MRKLIVVLAIALFVLHQDFWYWKDPSLVLGFLPIGLAYHALYSLLAAGLWGLAVKYAWPTEVEAFAEGPAEPAATEGQGSSNS